MSEDQVGVSDEDREGMRRETRWGRYHVGGIELLRSHEGVGISSTIHLEFRYTEREGGEEHEKCAP